MTEPEVEAADIILRRHEVQYVVVGGQAIGKTIRATGDVDVMVTAADYADTIAALQSDEDLEFQWEDQGVARFAMRLVGGEFLDVIDTAKFTLPRGGGKFFIFLVEEESTERDGIRYATPAAVWYTRLMIPRWRHYSDKILQDLLGGVGAGRMRRVVEIAHRFGTEEILRERVAYVRSEMRRPDLEYVLKEE
ncbi:MAG TPA: hypothetical protein VGG32_08850 [Thermoplasmata archaeon]|jgi:hypothetical protein